MRNLFLNPGSVLSAGQQAWQLHACLETFKDILAQNSITSCSLLRLCVALDVTVRVGGDVLHVFVVLEPSCLSYAVP